MRVAAQQVGRGVQAGLAQHLENAAVGIVNHTRVHAHGLAQLCPDPQGGVERGGRILGHVGDPGAPHGPQFGPGQAQQVNAVDAGPRRS